MPVNRQLCKECLFVKVCDIDRMIEDHKFPSCHTPATEDEISKKSKNGDKCPTPK